MQKLVSQCRLFISFLTTKQSIKYVTNSDKIKYDSDCVNNFVDFIQKLQTLVMPMTSYEIHDKALIKYLNTLFQIVRN